jgi:pilus assembly protein Flp/PilA
MISAIKKVFRDDEGGSLVEYGLLIMLIALAAIAAMSSFGGSINSMFSNEANDL